MGDMTENDATVFMLGFVVPESYCKLSFICERFTFTIFNRTFLSRITLHTRLVHSFYTVIQTYYWPLENIKCYK